MRKALLILFVAFLRPCLISAREVPMPSMGELFAKAATVFVGRVKSIESSGLTTTGSYPTWQGITFEWLVVDSEVIEPLKEAGKGHLIRTLMLSVRKEAKPSAVPHRIMNGPGMVRPEKGRLYLFCVVPTNISNAYVAVTAPWDDDAAVFLLDRGAPQYSEWRKRPDKRIDPNDPFKSLRERDATVWTLVDDEGSLSSTGAEQIRTEYQLDLAKASPAIVRLRWPTGADQQKNSGSTINLEHTQNKTPQGAALNVANPEH